MACARDWMAHTRASGLQCNKKTTRKENKKRQLFPTQQVLVTSSARRTRLAHSVKFLTRLDDRSRSTERQA